MSFQDTKTFKDYIELHLKEQNIAEDHELSEVLKSQRGPKLKLKD